MNDHAETSNMAALITLPLLTDGVKAHYEGSIDKKGGNADWDWYLYQDERGEWVLFEYEGSGCVYNLVQHRYPSCTEPTFRIYVDGAKEPLYTIRHSEFGEVYPFIEPLASRYIGPIDHGRGPIRVIRSFVPIPFRRKIKITSDIRLEGCDRSKDEGGWGHVVYHTYSEGQPMYPGVEEADYNTLTDLWKSCGNPVIRSGEGRISVSEPFLLAPGEEKVIFQDNDAGLVSAIRIRTREFEREDLKNLCLCAYWDREAWEKPDLNGNFGCIFHNELGYHGVRYLLAGMSAEGWYYNYYPMPYRKSARIQIRNEGTRPVQFDYAAVDYTREFVSLYQACPFGYFRSSKYYTRKHTQGSDSVIAEISGNGHIVASVITGFGRTTDSRADCEGDVRVYIDGCRTPQIESDGSESYSCYGWGFETPPEGNPAGGYDGHEHKDWSMARLLMGEKYPFLSGVRFQIESGGCNDVYMEHSGMVFYYGRDEVRLRLLQSIQTGNEESERENSYQEQGGVRLSLCSFFEGDDDDDAVSKEGYCWMEDGSFGTDSEAFGSRFTVRLPEGIRSLILRRVSDQKQGRQRAAVWVDGIRLPNDWYVPDRNEYKRWLEDEYTIPGSYLAGKKEIRIRIEPVRAGGRVCWNEFGYRILAVMER